MAQLSTEAPGDCEIVVIGAGIVGVSIAVALCHAGHDVKIVDAGSLVSGATAAGEGNLMLSDKLPGPELDLALWSLRLWVEQAAELGDAIEFEPKGGLVVARTDRDQAALQNVLHAQRKHGVEADSVSSLELRELEPLLTHDAAGGVLYPGDCQVQPVRATAALLTRHQVRLFTNQRVTKIDPAGDGLSVHLRDSTIQCDWVINAAGAWAGEIAAAAGCRLDIKPRRGQILVTEPVRTMVHHKVYEANYVATTQSSEGQAQFSSVVEGTASGTILLGSSRELVGFRTEVSMRDLTRLAHRAIGLFPCLADVRIMRTYSGFRPASPDHLPVIGPDPLMPRLIHASGHEGAGIGLAPATAQLTLHHIDGGELPINAAAFLPSRFAGLDAS